MLCLHRDQNIILHDSHCLRREKQRQTLVIMDNLDVFRPIERALIVTELAVVGVPPCSEYDDER
jgi:hypothetical protein